MNRSNINGAVTSDLAIRSKNIMVSFVGMVAKNISVMLNKGSLVTV